MTLVLEHPKTITPFSYEEAQLIRTQAVWERLEQTTVDEAVNEWLKTLSEKTRINYASGIRMLTERGLINPMVSLQAFALYNHEAIIDRIKLVFDWSECTRQARAACYISFTTFLSRRMQGLIKKAIPSKEGTNKTFYRVREKVKSHAMTQAQWLAFLVALEEINLRDCLIAKLILQGGKRINEVLSLQTEQIDWEQNEITFKQSKTKGMSKETVITYPSSVMIALRNYLGERKGWVFVTSSLRPVMINQLASTFKRAGEQAGIPFKVTPHVLRASAVTFLKQQGFSDSDIMGITGHASSQMIYAYDKSSRANNASKKVSLV
jgi:integrase